jgi:hypothetical protein
MKQSLDEAVAEAFSKISAQNGEGPIDIASVFRGVPVVVRAALAAVILAAAERPLNVRSVAEAGGYSRGTAYRNNKEALNLIIEGAPILASGILGRTARVRPSTHFIQKSRREIGRLAQLRQALMSAESERDCALSYARDLHQQLAPEFHEILKEKKNKVRRLRVMEEPQ